MPKYSRADRSRLLCLALRSWGRPQRIINMQIFRSRGAFVVLAAFLSMSAAKAEERGRTSSAEATSVEVVMTDYMFTPDKLQFRANTPYHLRFVNNTSRGHSFDAPELFAAMRIADDDQSKISDGKIEVARGQTVDVNLVPQTPGTYKFQCSHFLHATFGMTGEAVIR
jgi:plastocyanin